MIALDKNMPKSCECCPCNDDLYRCGVTGIPFGEVDNFDEFEERMPNCPLIDLTDDGKRVVRKFRTVEGQLKDS